LSENQKKHLFVFVLGPTAAGKSRFAMEVGAKHDWPLINCDSLQVYKKLDIGTAKPSRQERDSHTHYLYDFVEPPQTLTAADYLKEVQNCLEKNKLEKGLFVGGSGFYIQALEKGLYPDSKVSERVKAKVKNWIEEDGFEALYHWLQEKDPDFAKKISINDHYRIRRSVQVMMTQNKSMTELKEEMKNKNYSILPPHQKLKIGLKAEKSVLRDRVHLRTQRMISEGFVKEVESLLAEGLEDWAPIKSVGYKEVVAYLKGEIPWTSLEDRIVTSTMQLIKKQMTWFKRDEEIHWFDLSEQEVALNVVNDYIRNYS
jgi:tRNA dimethylallyltransferase